MYYVYSTLTCDMNYVLYEQNNNKDISVAKHSILIKGGHGIANKHFVTPQGVVTEVSDQDLDLLKDDYNFKQHVDNGFITFHKKRTDTEKAIENMALKDRSAPLTPEDFDKGQSSTKENPIYTRKTAKSV